MSKRSKYLKYNISVVFQQFEKRAEDNKSWFELGRNVGLEVVDDEEAGAEEEQMEEDRSPKDHGPRQGCEEKDSNRYIYVCMNVCMHVCMYVCRKGRNINTVCVYVCVYVYVYVCNYLFMSKRSKLTKTSFILAIRTVAAGHRMIADGWGMFEEAITEAGAGDLPQLLRSVRSMTTPPPATPPPAQSTPPPA